mgnify:CR=1 FL=1
MQVCYKLGPIKADRRGMLHCKEENNSSELQLNQHQTLEQPAVALPTKPPELSELSQIGRSFLQFEEEYNFLNVKSIKWLPINVQVKVTDQKFIVNYKSIIKFK